MEIMEIYVVLLCACTIAAIFVERGQATNVYPPREFSDNERDLRMMLTSCILYNKLAHFAFENINFSNIGYYCLPQEKSYTTHIYFYHHHKLSLLNYPLTTLIYRKRLRRSLYLVHDRQKQMELCLLSFFHDTN